MRVYILLFMLFLALNSIASDGEPITLSAQEQASVRKAVYCGRLTSVSTNRDFRSTLDVPKVLSDLHKKNAVALIDLLTRIADGGNPSDSIRAASYAIELTNGPGSGELCASLYKTETYDVVDKDWGHTPRDHWVGHLRTKVKK